MPGIIQVNEDDVWSVRLEQIERNLPAFSHDHARPEGFEHQAQEVAGVAVVIDDKRAKPIERTPRAERLWRGTDAPTAGGLRRRLP